MYNIPVTLSPEPNTVLYVFTIYIPKFDSLKHFIKALRIVTIF